MLAFVTKKHALTAVRKPLPTLRRGWALVRVRLAGQTAVAFDMTRESVTNLPPRR